jgi:ABC-type glycerol-3-phosphate transport system substrate-binding protein
MTPRLPIRPLGALTLGLLLALGAAGCRKEPPARMPDGRIPVRVNLLLISTAQVEYYAWAEREYERRNPEVDIQIEQFPGSSLKDFEIKLRLQFASRQAPDVFLAGESVMATFARLGLLAPAPPKIEQMIQQNSVNDMVRGAPYVDGVPYGIVSDAVWQALYYNKAMFREAGLDPERPPQTWAEMLNAADRLTIRDAEGRPTRSGLSLRKTGFKPGTAEKWLTFLYSAGGQPFTDDGTASAFNSPAGRRALDLYQDVLFDRRIDSIDLEGDQQGFGQGRTAMLLRESHVIRWLGESYPDLEFGVAPVPADARSVSSGGSYLLSVARDSPNVGAAWDFVAFLLSDEAYTRYVSIGGLLPTTASVAALPEYRDDPLLQAFLQQEVAVPPRFDRSDRALDLLGAYIERFCYGEIGADEMLDRAAADVDALLRVNRERTAPDDAR